MKNINKNLIKKILLGFGISLAILAILALGGIFMPKQAYAEYAYYHFNPSDNNAPLYPAPKPEVIPVYQPVYQPQPVIYQTQPVYTQLQTQPVYQNTTNYSNAPQANTSTTEVSNTDKTISTGVNGEDYSSIAANSVFGGFSFLPSGLMQWILLAIFIVVIVILIRKATGKDEEYYSTPLKHA